MKLINAARKDPHSTAKGPIAQIAVRQSPPGINGPTIGMIMLSTSDLTSVFAAKAMISAMAKPIILYSFKKSLNSEINPILTLNIRAIKTFLSQTSLPIITFIKEKAQI
jgi:hypothetical protein